MALSPKEHLPSFNLSWGTLTASHLSHQKYKFSEQNFVMQNTETRDESALENSYRREFIFPITSLLVKEYMRKNWKGLLTTSELFLCRSELHCEAVVSGL